jgi:hypothetical protein
VSRQLTSEPGAQRAQYYSGATSVAIFDQLMPVSPQSVALGRGNTSDGRRADEIAGQVLAPGRLGCRHIACGAQTCQRRLR